MRTTSHDGIREDLKAFLDGELRPMRRFQVRSHVRSCADCQKEIEEMKKITHNLFASDGAPGLSDPLRSRLLGTMTDTAGGPSRPLEKPLWSRPATWLYGGGGAIATASVLMFGVTYFSALHAADPAADRASVAAPAPATEAKAYTSAATTASFAGAATALKSTGSGPESVTARAMPRPMRLTEHAVPKSVTAFAAAPPPAAAALQVQSVGAGGAATSYVESDKVSAYRGDSLSGSGIVRRVDNEAKLGVEVDDVEMAGEKVGDMVKADGGYVATNNLTMDNGVKTDLLTVKFPSKDFDSMIVGFSRLGNVIAKNVTGEDITDKTGDATSDEQAQVDQVAETEQRLHAAGRMSDGRKSQLEEELNEKQSALADARARLGMLRKTARLATVNLTLTEAPKKIVTPEPKSEFWSGMSETNRAATVAFQAAIRVPILIGIWVIALSPIWFPLALLHRYLARKQEDESRQNR